MRRRQMKKAAIAPTSSAAAEIQEMS